MIGLLGGVFLLGAALLSLVALAEARPGEDTTPAKDVQPSGYVPAYAATRPKPRCPFCGKPVPGLLSGCPEWACTVRELNDDQAFARSAGL